VAFADLLIELRTARGMSQEELAESAAVSVRAISDLERGITRRPHRQTVKALADGLGITGWERASFEEVAEQAKASTLRRRAPQVGLPAPTSSIIGREADVTAVSRLLRGSTTRLVTVTGPGGVGKTRLATEVAWRVAAGFERVDGLDLSPLGTPDDVPGALAAALGCASAAADPVQAVALLVGDRPWLLVLDSFEHVAEAALGLAGLLGRCPRLRLLVTSRAPLRLRGEHLWPLSPLPVPAESERDVAALGTVPAMTLLVERARAVRPGFVLAGANAAVLARLCRRLDGLPLAIELAAAQLRTLDPADLTAQLDGQLSILRAEAIDVPDRQHTLQSTVAWSVERLGAEPRRMLTVLAVFAGGAAPALARAVLDRAGLDPAALDRSVSVLAATSLVTIEERAGTPRITMLDTIREVAAGMPADSGTATGIRRAHAATVLDLLRQDLDGVDAELDNVRAGLGWAVGHEPGLLDGAAVEAFSRYCLMRSRFGELYRILSAIADAAADPATRAAALRGAGMGANETGDHQVAIAFAQQAAELFEKLADVPGRCAALTLLGNAHKALGSYDPAQAAYRTCLDLARSADYPRGVTIALNNLGTLAHDRADHELARRYYRESLEVKHRLGDEHGIAVTLMNLGAVANDLGRYAEARVDLRRAVATLRAHGEQHRLAFGLVLLAEAECGLGEYAAARAAATEGLAISREVSHEPTVGLALTRLGDIAVATGDDRGAESLYREALPRASGPPEVARVLERLAAVRARTSPDEARELLGSADEMRRAHGAPPPPADRGLLERTRRLTGGG
jgi:predicted ATPase/tetratricopeptide (TPR) repeat protein/DNA-binding XRE family transcriptional regulator